MIHSRKSPVSSRRVASLSVIAATAVLLAGCGSASKALSAPSAKSVATSSSATSSSAASSSAAAVAPTAAASATTPASAPTVGGAEANSSFCQLARSFIASSTKESDAFTTDSPTALKAYITTAQMEVTEFGAAAPASISAATKTLVALDTQIFAALKASNYNFADASAAIAKVGSDPSLAADSMQVTNYLTLMCGIADVGASASAGAGG